MNSSEINLYAVIQTGGKQFVFSPNNWYDVDLLKENVIGDFLWLSKVLFFQKENKIQIGKPFLKNIKFPAKILQLTKGKKLTILRTKPKKNYLRVKGHRQFYTRLQLDRIVN